jgi:hypothetical protein
MDLYNAANAHFFYNDLSNVDENDLRTNTSLEQQRFGQLVQHIYPWQRLQKIALTKAFYRLSIKEYSALSRLAKRFCNCGMLFTCCSAPISEMLVSGVVQSEVLS